MNNNDRKKVILEEMLHELELPVDVYLKSVSRYEDLGEWFGREGSSIAKCDPEVFPQGSFRLGTAIKPLDSEKEYDLDLGCKLRGEVSIYTHSQKDLVDMIYKELNAYRIFRQIQNNIERKHRCLRLNYKDNLNFHMDVVSCIPKSDNLRKSIYDSLIGNMSEERAGVIADNAVMITDDRSSKYDELSDDWNPSNPQGYADWFEKSMLESMYRTDELLRKAQVEEIKLFERKTNLQKVIQLLKRHRDIMFRENEDSKPISIIITTLATRAYNGETDLAEALENILSGMERYINASTPRVPNPVYPSEDFADKWAMPEASHLRLEHNFRSWIEAAQRDFDALGRDIDSSFVDGFSQEKLGVRLDMSELKKSVDFKDTFKPVHHNVETPAKPWLEI